MTRCCRRSAQSVRHPKMSPSSEMRSPSCVFVYPNLPHLLWKSNHKKLVRVPGKYLEAKEKFSWKKFKFTFRNFVIVSKSLANAQSNYTVILLIGRKIFQFFSHSSTFLHSTLFIPSLPSFFFVNWPNNSISTIKFKKFSLICIPYRCVRTICFSPTFYFSFKSGVVCLCACWPFIIYRSCSNPFHRILYTKFSMSRMFSKIILRKKNGNFYLALDSLLFLAISLLFFLFCLSHALNLM